ncbi:MAG: hypothetical protein IPM39_27530 [Chloroflexi bacterium]|nr:hypothetical protein [Chloroflexota bacterium]
MTIASEKKRCLILSCSRAKHGAPELLPAVQRYTGPMYQVLRRYLREKPEEAATLIIYILSARHGLIDSQTPILPYDQKMTPARAAELHTAVLHKVEQEIAPVGYAEIFLAMGQTYLLALDGLDNVLGVDTKVITARSSAGTKLTELRNWLWEISPTIPRVEEQVVMPNVGRVTAVLRGRTLSLTTAEAEEHLSSSLFTAPDSARQVRGWYVVIGGEKASPKWAAHHLFDVPVSDFSADEARRVLRKLGLNCYRT